MIKRILSGLILTSIFMAISCSTPQVIDDSLKREQYDGKQLFKSRCLSCHLLTPPKTKQEAATMLAPPVIAIMYHVKEGTGAELEMMSRKYAIDFIMDYVRNPTREKALCSGHAIENFGLMPSMKETVTAEELNAIANYLYDNFPPKDFDHDKMERKQHKQ